MNIIFGMLLIASGVGFAFTVSPIMIMVGVMGTDDPTRPGWVDYWSMVFWDRQW